jgi:hypothetical protein
LLLNATKGHWEAENKNQNHSNDNLKGKRMGKRPEGKGKRAVVKMVRGPIEEFIRQAYFGGNSDIFVDGNDRLVSLGPMSQRPEGHAYHYELNSHYPIAMKNPMPTGNPIFSTNKNLDYYKLGFVFANITPPPPNHYHDNGLSCA